MPSGRRSDIAEPSLALRGDAGGDVPAIVSGEPFFCLVEIVSNSSKSIRRSQKVQSAAKKDYFAEEAKDLAPRPFTGGLRGSTIAGNPKNLAGVAAMCLLPLVLL